MSLEAGPPQVGVDVVSVERVATLVARNPRFAQRVFTDAERRECQGRPERWASRWAAKEAVRKLAGARGITPLPAFRDVEVRTGPGGAPAVTAPAVGSVALSLSHDAGLAVAVAVGVTAAAGHIDVPDGLRLPDRPDDANKGTFGTVVVVAGAHGFSGAAYLAAMGAARSGAGRVRLCVPASLHPIVAVKCTEVMAHPLPDAGRGVLTAESVATIRRDHLGAADALVVGPGLGRDPQTAEALVDLLDGLRTPLVVDADGLNIAAERHLAWPRTGAPAVLTPHPAEMARLLGTDVREVQSDREGVARRYAAEHGVVVVLKGAETVIAGPDGRLHCDRHRLVALASGGTGDVLAGMVGAFVAAGLPPFDAAVAAVTVHAEAGAAVQAVRGRAGALASDLVDALPAAQERLRRLLEARGR